MYTVTATAMKMGKTNGILLRNRQIHIVGQISPLFVMVCGHHCRTPSISTAVVIAAAEFFMI